MTRAGAVRNSQRSVRACTTCVRRKIRCSKTIPCTACVRQDKANSCQRERVAVVTRRRTGSHFSLARHVDDLNNGTDSHVSSPPNLLGAADTLQSSMTPERQNEEHNAHSLPGVPPELTNELLAETPTSATPLESRLTNEAAATLEFLAHGRRNVLDRFAGRNAVTHPTLRMPSGCDDFGEQWDTFLPIDEARTLLALHQDHLSWMHNVVHLPTFRSDCEHHLLSKDCDKSWLALYYALLSQTLYHIDGDYLYCLPRPITTSRDTSRILFDKSIETLFQAGFMDNHKLTSVQAICLLLQVAHNFDKSDLICVLIASAIRVAQCLNLHRLGSDRGNQSVALDTMASRGPGGLIDQEIRKRVWWFLVRYDWFQIPFQNTHQIQPTQFNTPMPANCFDDAERMIQDDSVFSYPADRCTSSSWTNSLNEISVLICKHQDRMVKVGYPGNDSEKVSKLYDQVIWADREIKKLYATWPDALREAHEGPRESSDTRSFPVELMPGMVLICTAHKILTVHRHFQLLGFRDERFAFSQLSCISMAERGIEAVQTWPRSLETRIVSKMWTTLTHVVSCCVVLAFALLFKHQNALTYDIDRVRRNLEFGKQFISQEAQTSSIARRGVRLLTALMGLESCCDYSSDIELDVGNMVRQVALEDNGDGGLQAAGASQIILPFGSGIWDIDQW